MLGDVLVSLASILCWVMYLLVWQVYVSEYRKRDLMAQKLFFELVIPSYSMIFEL